MKDRDENNNTFDDDNDLITLTTTDGEDIDFIEVAGVELNGGYYAILQPVELFDGMEEDEALVFKVTGSGEDDVFEIVTEDEIIDAVFDEYNRLLDENN